MDLEQKTLSYLLVASKKAYLLQILTKNATELFFRPKKIRKKKSAVEKLNVGDRLKRCLPGFGAMAGQFNGVNGRFKFTPPPSEARSERSEVVRTYVRTQVRPPPCGNDQKFCSVKKVFVGDHLKRCLPGFGAMAGRF